jgi:hypothetical protein
MVTVSVQMTAGIRDEANRHNVVLDRVKNSMGGAEDMLRASVTKFNKVQRSPQLCQYHCFSHRFLQPMSNISS